MVPVIQNGKETFIAAGIIYRRKPELIGELHRHQGVVLPGGFGFSSAFWRCRLFPARSAGHISLAFHVHTGVLNVYVPEPDSSLASGKRARSPCFALGEILDGMRSGFDVDDMLWIIRYDGNDGGFARLDLFVPDGVHEMYAVQFLFE